MVRAQRMTIVNAMLAFVVLIVILQLWLLTATMNAYLGGDTATRRSGRGRQPRLPRPQRRAALVPVRSGLSDRIAGRHRRTQACRAVADLFPGYFALVMATGIVSIAAHAAADAAHRLGAARHQHLRLRGA